MALKFRVFCVAVSAAMLGACASTTADKEEEFASRLIAEKAAIAAAAQRDYAALLAEDYTTLQKRWARFDEDVIDVDYIGNPKELVQSVASRYGMGFAEMGKQTDLRPINIRMKGVKPDDLLRNIGNQIHQGADIVFNKPEKLITIEYKNRDEQQPVNLEVKKD